MATERDAGDNTLAPDDAFSVLGNETRMEILQTLAEVDEPLPFSALRERVGVTDSGQFNYHLGKLVGHFLEKSDDGYDLRRAGERVIEAVVSGAVTETPVIEPTTVDWPCSQCGASPIHVSFRQEWVSLFCTECPGLYGGSMVEDDQLPEEMVESGRLGGAELPSAAIQGRDAAEVLQTSITWSFLERVARSKGICPRCSATFEKTLTVCENHDQGDGICEDCGSRHEVTYEGTCPNCPHESSGLLRTALRGDLKLMDFMTSHGLDPITANPNEWRVWTNAWETEVVSVDPLKVRITFTLEGDVLSLTVDEQLNVIDVSETGESATG